MMIQNEAFSCDSFVCENDTLFDLRIKVTMSRVESRLVEFIQLLVHS